MFCKKNSGLPFFGSIIKFCVEIIISHAMPTASIYNYTIYTGWSATIPVIVVATLSSL